MTTKSHVKLIGQENVKLILDKLNELSKIGRNMTFLLQGTQGSGTYTLLNNTFKDADYFTATNIQTLEELTQCIRKCIIVKIKEKNTIIKGEVLELKSDRIVLKTSDMQSEFSLGKKMKHEMLKEKISPGDAIQIVKETGKVTKLGKVFVKTHDFDVLGPDVRFVDCVEGNLVNVVESENSLSLYECDYLNSSDFYGTKNVNLNIRQQIDSKVSDWIEEGLATIEYRTMIIMDCEFLSNALLSYCRERIEKYMSSVCLVTSIPDFSCNEAIKNILTINMETYTEGELKCIIQQYCQNRGYNSDESIVDVIFKNACETTIKRALEIYGLACNQYKAKNMPVTRENVDAFYELLK